MKKKNKWMIISMGSLCLSIASLLLPAITYTNLDGMVYKYNVFGLLDAEAVLEEMFSGYVGTTFRNVSDQTAMNMVIILTIIGVSAIIMAFAGIKSMAKQYESSKPFTLAMIGLIGTAVPSVALLILFAVSKNYYLGSISLGAYIWVTPVAMVIACINVTIKHRLTQKELRLQKMASLYIRPAGDLPVKTQGGFRYGRQ